MKIVEITPNGCVLLEGAPYLETGDFDRAKSLLSDQDYERVRAVWAPELIGLRKTELEQQALTQAEMFV